MKIILRNFSIILLLLLMTSCGVLKSSPLNKPGKQTSAKKQSQNKPKVIDQELKKQADIYKEIEQHRMQEEQKARKQSQKRFKKLEKQRKKSSES